MKNRKICSGFGSSSWRRVFLWSLAALLALGLANGLAFSQAQPVTAASETSNLTCTDNSDPDTCQATGLLDDFLNFMAILVLPLIVIMIIIGGIQYSLAAANPEAIKAARARIYKAVLALVCFIGLWSFLKWLLPGGLE